LRRFGAQIGPGRAEPPLNADRLSLEGAGPHDHRRRDFAIFARPTYRNCSG